MQKKKKEEKMKNFTNKFMAKDKRMTSENILAYSTSILGKQNYSTEPNTQCNHLLNTF